MELANNIRKLRKAYNMTQEELAEKMELSPMHISRLERAVTTLSHKDMVKMASIFNVKPQDIIASPKIIERKIQKLAQKNPEIGYQRKRRRDVRELDPSEKVQETKPVAVPVRQEEILLSGIPEAPYLGDIGEGKNFLKSELIAGMSGKRRSTASTPSPSMIKVSMQVEHGFILRVTDKSVEDIVPEGYFLLISPDIPDLKKLDGRLVIISHEKECFVRKWNHTLQQAEACSDDYRRYKPIRFNTDDSYHLIGVVMQSFYYFSA